MPIIQHMETEKMSKEFAVIFFASVSPQSIGKLWQVIEYRRQFPRHCEKMTLILSSPGGAAHWGVTGHNYLRDLQIEIDTRAVGAVSSAGLFLYCLGKERRAEPYAYFTIHPSMYYFAENGAYDTLAMKEAINQTQHQNEVMTDVLSKTTGQTKEKVTTDMWQRTVLNAAQAKEYGLVTDIAESFLPEQGIDTYRIGEVDSPIPSPYAPTSMPFFSHNPSPIYPGCSLPVGCVAPHQPVWR